MGLSRRCSATGIALILSLVFFVSPAAAHSIYIFAFPDDSQICTNSYFGGKAKVRGGQVSMAAVSGEILATAKTDEAGNACFDRPERIQDLIFTVEASGGHRAEFKMPASEPAAGSSAYDSNDGRPAPETMAGEQAAGAAWPSTRAGSLTRDDLRQALSPIMLKLAEMESAQNSRINLKDVVGGLGWLLGLAGVAFFAAGRKNKTRIKERS
ncbi:MAG: hypothetical protein LBS31_00090 [Candidatus Adiutrix sp.]|jgi:nickel transport protein|nr:hypothetical protein [Candidatus Adiutrix sp.]